MAISNTQFDDVSALANVNQIVRTWGAAWGDFNGDTYPDLYVSNHQYEPTLYLNNGDGTFQDVAATVVPPHSRDNHGAAWADFDNDGDADLIQLAGGAAGNGSLNNPNIRHQLYVNNSGQFVDQATELDVAAPLQRGRTPMWVDIDEDGLLDLVTMGQVQPDGSGKSTIFIQEGDQFVDVGQSIGFRTSVASFGLLADFAGDDNLELGIAHGGRPRLVVYDSQGNSLTDITASILEVNSFPGFKDAVAADFNGDLFTDLYLARTNNSINNSAVTVDDLGRIVASLKAAEEIGYSFSATGEITFDLFISPPQKPEEIYIGASALDATNFELTKLTREGLAASEWRLTISPNDPRVMGLPSQSERENQTGVYIGYEPSEQRWSVLSGENRSITTVVSQAGNNTITDVQSTNFINPEFKAEDALYFGSEQGLENQTEFSGINSTLGATKSAVAGDFDNDMDIDIYALTTEKTENTPNILYENQGDGTFIAVPNAGGAQGIQRGLGDVVVSADYDLDGFLDLFITNGAWPPPLAEEGSYQLLRNNPNGNHWLEIDLEGVVSNRDGIGAKVYVTADGVTQVREQSGGTHLFSQNHQRLHFGLADNSTVDQILVVWPNGRTQQINNVPANQLIRIVEEPQAPFLSGAPDTNSINSPGVFLWKETFDGPYQLRVFGKAGETIESTINLITSAPSSSRPVALNSNDSLMKSEFGFSLNSTVRGTTYTDGIDFQVAPGSTALLSVTMNGEANPRQLYVGGGATRVAPAGWILNSGDFPSRPDFSPGEDLGLFVGQGTDESTIEFRWNGDGSGHRANLNVLTSESTAEFSPVALGARDTFTSGDNSVNIQSQFRPWFDGLDVNVAEPVNVGFTYEQDGFNQPHRVNRYDPFFGFQNAYELPVADPFGLPDYDSGIDKGLFLWKDEGTDLWRLRASAGGSYSRFAGSIISDQPIEFVTGVAIESSDVVDTSTSTEINFDLKVSRTAQDGINFRLPTGASAELNLGTNGNGPTSLVKVGAQQWELSALPLDLSGWDIAT